MSDHGIWSCMLTTNVNTRDNSDPGLVSYVDMSVMLKPHLALILPKDVQKIQDVSVKGKNLTAVYLKEDGNYTFDCEASRVFPRKLRANFDYIIEAIFY